MLQVDVDVGHAVGPDWTLSVAERAPFNAKAMRAAAGAVLADRPIDGRAMRLMGSVAAAAGDADLARVRYALAARFAPRDPIAQAMMIDQALSRGRVGEAVGHLDMLLRASPPMRGVLLPVVATQLEDPRLVDALGSALAANPPWRRAFVEVLMHPDTQARGAEEMLSALSRRSRLDTYEQGVRIEVLERLGEARRARALWLQALPRAQQMLDGPLFDGGFEGEAPTGGFGWSWDDVPGVTIGIDPSASFEGARSLILEFSGRETQLAGPRQRLALAPGRYELSIAYDDATVTSRRFAWRVSCAQGAVLGNLELAPVAAVRWSTARTEFEVPPGCESQRIALRHEGRSLAERIVRGSLRVDAITLRKSPVVVH